MSEDPDEACSRCVKRKRPCLWDAAEHNSLVKACDGCRKDKLSCPGRPGTVKVPRGKKRQRPSGEPSPRGKGKKRQKSPVPEVPEVPEVMEYDDQAWVAAANSIVAELARTNSLLERNILAAEGSREAVDRMCSGLDLFLQQQREFQALLFGELRMGSRMTADVGRMASDDGRMSSDEGRKSSDVEEDEKDGSDETDGSDEKGGADEEMNEGSGSEVGGSGEADESMEM